MSYASLAFMQYGLPDANEDTYNNALFICGHILRRLWRVMAVLETHMSMRTYQFSIPTLSRYFFLSLRSLYEA